MRGVIASCAYAGGRRIADVPVEEAGRWTGRPGQFVWIGLHDPDDGLLRLVQRQFGLHDLAIEDALHAHQRPKVELYGDSLFLVLRTARLEDGRVIFGETHVFAGCDYVVTVRHGASSAYATVRERAESAPRMLSHGVDFVIYAIMDFIVDCYFPVLESLERQTSVLTRDLLAHPPASGGIQAIHALRSDLEELRRVASPLLDVCLRLERFDLPMIDEDVRPYYRDVHDHVIRVNEGIGALREDLSFAFEASMMLASARQNDVTRKLAAWAAILAVPTAVAGIYGMNFKNMPELDWTYGYYATLGLILVLCVALYAWFRRIDWL